MSHTESPPVDLTTVDDVQHLRDWAFARLAAGAHDEVLDVVAGYSELAFPNVEGFDELEVELHVRIGIATERPHLVAIARQWLMEPDPEEPIPPRTQFVMGVGAAWEIGLCSRAVRLRHARRLLGAARQALKTSLASGALDEAETAECRAALTDLYGKAFRCADPEDRPPLPSCANPSFTDAWLRLRGVSRSLEPGARALAVQSVLQGLAAWCEPRWPVVGGPWFISDAFGITVDLSEPVDERGRHRVALADTIAEIEDLDAGFDRAEAYGEKARAMQAEIEMVGLAEEALARASLAGLADTRRTAVW